MATAQNTFVPLESSHGVNKGFSQPGAFSQTTYHTPSCSKLTVNDAAILEGVFKAFDLILLYQNHGIQNQSMEAVP
jgi:hypothetical protein